MNRLADNAQFAKDAEQFAAERATDTLLTDVSWNELSGDTQNPGDKR